MGCRKWKSGNFFMVLVLAVVIAGCSGNEQKAVDKSETSKPATAIGSAEALTKCRASIQELGSDLKVVLKETIREGGPSKALDVCNERAAIIGKQVGKRQGVTIGRTSLKWRNPNNAPDAWERDVLNQFAQRKAEGARPQDLEKWEVVVSKTGQRNFRYMKAIGTSPLCLKCHGPNLNPEVQAKITAIYPEDKATGFHSGDLRGAFTVTLPLERSPLE